MSRPDPTYRLYSQFWEKDGTPIRCFICMCPDYRQLIVDTLDGQLCEYKDECCNCGTYLSYWSYGHYADTEPMSDRDILEISYKVAYGKGKIKL